MSKALAGAFLVVSLHGTAAAAGFDLDCTLLDDGGQPRLNPPKLHIQIDRENGRWCDRQCGTVQDMVRLTADELVLRDETAYGDIKRIVYQPAEGLLTEDFGIGKTYERRDRYACRVEEFGRFEPYLAKDPQPLRQWQLIERGDFLKDADGKDLGGIVGYRVAVDSEGKPKDCTVFQTSGNPALDGHTCSLIMARLKFSPAASRTGQPIESLFSGRVNWFVVDD